MDWTLRGNKAQTKDSLIGLGPSLKDVRKILPIFDLLSLVVLYKPYKISQTLEAVLRIGDIHSFFWRYPAPYGLIVGLQFKLC